MSNPNKPRTVVPSRDITEHEAQVLCEILDEVLASETLSYERHKIIDDIRAAYWDGLDDNAIREMHLEDAIADGYDPEEGRYD